ncbi:MAG TPA: hypothetical protein VFX17_00370 [Patescibacteria group bacterium]|nr:hypothetical protein [Patescibacteria group bacterium]
MNKLLFKIALAAATGIILGWLIQNIALGIAAFTIMLVVLMLPIFIRYAQDNPEHVWFKRRLVGWGWTPVTWQGWLCVIVYVGLLMAFAFSLDDSSSPREIGLMLVLPFIILTSLLLRIAYRKGEKPKWQWGKDLDKYQ